MPPTVTVIVVALGARASLKRALASIPEGCEVIVVDHGHPLGRPVVEGDLPRGARLVRADRNRGFGAGCNEGARLAGGELLLLLNPDAELEPGAVETLVARIERDEAIGVVGGRLLRPDGSDELSFGRRPRPWDLLVIALRLDGFARLFPWLGSFRMAAADRSAPAAPHWVSGALLLIPATIFRRVAGFDERFFMYCEDVYLCERVRASGSEVAYEPSARAHHRGGGTGPPWSARRHVEHWRSWRIYWGLRGLPGAPIVALTALAGAIRVVESLPVALFMGAAAASERIRCGLGLIRLSLTGPKRPSQRGAEGGFLEHVRSRTAKEAPDAADLQ
ncbi:MAG: hypothetical protein CME06_17250 [Gemmatimonadetes bacterium]|nr:hypothetical protein [Gemmatimonadota bacterium]